MAILGRTNPNDKYQALFEAAKKSRLPFDKEYWLNVMFWAGEQYVEWANQASTVRQIAKPQNHQRIPRPVVNKIKHFVLTEHAMLLSTRPTTDVLPASDDPQDISNANVALAFLTWLFDENVANFDGVLSRAALMALAGTEAYIKWTWNPRLNDGKGRGDITACSPLDVYPDPYATEFSRARYVFHQQFMDVEQIYDVYGVEIGKQNIQQIDPMRSAIQRELGMAPILQGALVTELWAKPNRRQPDGLYVVWSGTSQLVAPGPFPYAHKHLPFTQIGSVPQPNGLHYTSAVTDMRSPQMELNRFHAQGIEVRNAFANPKWAIDTTVELEADPDDSPNQILRGNFQSGQNLPRIIQPSGMPPNDNGQWIRNEMMDVVGLHEVSQAQVPGRVEAAKAIEMLKEADDGRLAEMLRTIKCSISEGGWQQLMLCKQYMKSPQVVPIYSRESLPEVKRFMAEQIDPGMRVRVTMGTGLARSRAARSDQIMLMWQNQIIRDPEIVAELLDMPVSTISPANAYDIRLARNENYTIADGTPVVPNSWDNHPLHRREHDNYRKTLEFQMLPSKTKTMFEFHCQMHDKLYAQQLGKQLQIQQMAAAVASGAGFQQPDPNAQGGDQGGGDQQGPPISGAGAQQPVNPFAAQDSPQGVATMMQRQEDHLNHPRV